MSENFKSTDGDEFDKLVEGLTSDTDFTNNMQNLNDEIDDIEAETIFDQLHDYALKNNYEADGDSYTEVDITSPLSSLVTVFDEACQAYSINPNEPDLQPEVYREVIAEVDLEAYALKDKIFSGDIISVTGSMVVDYDHSDDEILAVGIYEGAKVVGYFAGPAVAPMPDEVNALLLDDVSPAGVGVGIVIKNPAVIDSDGKIHTGLFSTHIVMPLNFVSLKVHKYIFPDDM